MDLNQKYGVVQLGHMHERIRLMGEAYGLRFASPKLMPNSHNALEAAEFARNKGLHSAYHQALMKAYFEELKDIGSLDVLKALAVETGLDPMELETAVISRKYENKLLEDAADASMNGIQNTPTYVLDGKRMIVGAQSIERFRHVLDDLLKENA